MAWKDSLLEASFRGIIFDCVRTDDAAERATAEHAYPYRDGADIEDLGRGPRKISIEAVFYGDNYESQLKAFLAALDEAGEGDLQHPVFGVVFAQLASYRVQHEADNVDQATVALEFVESTPSQPFFDRSLPSQQASAIAQYSGSTRDAATTLLADKVGEIFMLSAFGRVSALRSTMTAALSSIRARISGFISSGLDVIDFPRSWAADISAALRGIVDLRSFDTATIKSDWRAVYTNVSEPVLLPSYQAGSAPANDEKVIAAHVALEQALTIADTASIVLANEAQTPTMTPAEIEKVANDTRTLIEATIADYRTLYTLEQSRPVTEALKTTALGIQDAAAAVIEQRPPLILRSVAARANLHLAAHQWYGDYRRAAELMRLNPLVRLPNNLQAGDRLNAFAR